MKTMLVPLDGSPRSETVLPVVVALAGGGGYRVTLMSVWEVLPEEVANVGESHVRELCEQGMKSFRAYLGNVAATLANRGIEANTEVRCGRPAAEILAADGALKPDLVAMASKGRCGVADSVARGSRVPVLVLGPRTLEAWPPGEWHVSSILALPGDSAESEATIPVAMDMAREAGTDGALLTVPNEVLREKVVELIALAIASRQRHQRHRRRGARIGGRR
jgi:nucleotide-binding universal stress UspA family protein